MLGSNEGDSPNVNLRRHSTTVMIWSLAGALGVFLVSRPLIDPHLVPGAPLTWLLTLLVLPLGAAALLSYTIWWFTWDVERERWFLSGDQCARLLDLTLLMVRWLIALMAAVTLWFWLAAN